MRRGVKKDLKGEDSILEGSSKVLFSFKFLTEEAEDQTSKELLLPNLSLFCGGGGGSGNGLLIKRTPLKEKPKNLLIKEKVFKVRSQKGQTEPVKDDENLQRRGALLRAYVLTAVPLEISKFLLYGI